MILGQWFLNEFKAFKKLVEDRFDLLEQSVKECGPNADSERITKLEGEIRAMKARMGKKND